MNDENRESVLEKDYRVRSQLEHLERLREGITKFKPKKLSMKWTLDAEEDMRAFVSVECEREIVAAFAQEVAEFSKEEDERILKEILGDTL